MPADQHKKFVKELRGETQPIADIVAYEQQDTVMVYAACPICNRSPVIPACYITTPIIAGVMHTIYYCRDCFNTKIRPWARSFAGMDKVFNRID